MNSIPDHIYMQSMTISGGELNEFINHDVKVYGDLNFVTFYLYDRAVKIKVPYIWLGDQKSTEVSWEKYTEKFDEGLTLLINDIKWRKHKGLIK